MADDLRNSYQQISDDYLQKKSYPWQDFLNFVEQVDLEESDTVIDVGAGNGRNLHAQSASLHVALDLSTNLLHGYVGPEQGQKIAGALPKLPFRSQSTDMVLCIAVLHHLRTYEERVDALNELARLNCDTTYLISVWRKWRKRNREKIIAAIRDGEDIQDYVDHERPWYSSTREVKTTRFYHYYTFKELYNQLKTTGFQIDQVEYMGGKHDDANIFVKTTQQSPSK